MSRPPCLEVKGLSVSLPEFSLREVDLEVREGEYFVLLGPTGAGKTILLEAIAGIAPVQSGRIFLKGQEISALPPEKRRMGFVYQDYALFPHLSVAGNIAFGLAAPGRRSADTAKDRGQGWIREISALLGIDHLLERNPETLSGGEKQRVALARALATQPQLLLLDEPLRSLDPENREAIQAELRRVQRQLGVTILHISHDFEVAAALADRVGVIMDGRIAQVGTAREVFSQPGDEKVARFVGVRNIFRGEFVIDGDGRGSLLLDGLALAAVSGPAGPARAIIRPEDILLSREPLSSSARNHFQGAVVNLDDRGSYSYVTIRIPPPAAGGRSMDLVALVTRISALELELEVGREIYTAFKASALHIF